MLEQRILRWAIEGLPYRFFNNPGTIGASFVTFVAFCSKSFNAIGINEKPSILILNRR